MKKTYIIIIIVIAVYAVVSFIFLGIPAIKEANEAKKNSYVVIGNKSRWQHDRGVWTSMEDVDTVLANEKFQVYEDSQYIGEYSIQYYNDVWYLFDEQNNSRKLDGELFAFSGEKDIEVLNFSTLVQTLDDTDRQSFLKVMDQFNLPYMDFDVLTYQEKVLLDFDHDNNVETLYSISNLYTEQDVDKIFTFVYYVDKGRLQILLDNVVDIEDMYSNYIYEISNIIDVDNDQKYEIVIKQQPFYPIEDCHILFGLEGNKFQELKQCEG